MRVLFVSPPFAGHLDRLVPLAQAAQGEGHAVRVLTGPARLSFLRAHGIDAGAPPSLPPGALERVAEGFGRIAGRPHAAWAQLRANVALIPHLLCDLLNEIGAWRPDVLVADSVATMAGPAAMRSGLPWITTLASPPSLHAPSGTPGHMGGWRPPQGPVGHLRDAGGRAAHRLLRHAVLACLRGGLPPEIARPFRPDGTEAIYSPHAILGFGMTELEFPREWPPAFEMIGPVFGPALLGPPPAFLDPLPRDGPRVLATLGTHLPWARQRWRAGLARLAMARPSWLIVSSEGRMDGPAADPALGNPPNLRRLARVCYRRDVPRFDAVIHHGGTGIAYAAIVAGRPSLVVPHDFDQFDVAARIEWHGLGLRARSLRGAPEALDRLLVEDRPALARFERAAARYAPEVRFLEALAQIRAGAPHDAASRARAAAARPPPR